MAASVANVESNPIGGPGGVWKYAEITLDSSYAALGETINAADFGFKFFKAIFIAHQEDGYSIQAVQSSDKTTALIKVWVWGNASTSAATPFDSSAKDLSAMVIPVLVRGI